MLRRHREPVGPGDGGGACHRPDGQGGRPRPLTQGSKVTVVVRPQKLSVGAAAGANRLSGRVVSASYLGGSAIYEIDIGGKTVIRANALITGRVLREGEAIDLGFDPKAAFCSTRTVSGFRDAMSPKSWHGSGDAEAAPAAGSLPRSAGRHAVGMPQMGWRDAGLLAEHPAEMAGIGEAAAIGDVADLQVAAFQQRLRMMHPSAR